MIGKTRRLQRVAKIGAILGVIGILVAGIVALNTAYSGGYEVGYREGHDEGLIDMLLIDENYVYWMYSDWNRSIYETVWKGCFNDSGIVSDRPDRAYFGLSISVHIGILPVNCSLKLSVRVPQIVSNQTGDYEAIVFSDHMSGHWSNISHPEPNREYHYYTIDRQKHDVSIAVFGWYNSTASEMTLEQFGWWMLGSPRLRINVVVPRGGVTTGGWDNES